MSGSSGTWRQSSCWGGGDFEVGVETRRADIEFDNREGTKNASDVEHQKKNKKRSLELETNRNNLILDRS